MTDTSNGRVTGVDTGEVDTSKIMKILEYWAKEPEVDKGHERVLTL